MKKRTKILAMLLVVATLMGIFGTQALAAQLFDPVTGELEYDSETGYSKFQEDLADGKITVPGYNGNYNTFGSSDETNHVGLPDDYPDFAEIIDALTPFAKQDRSERVNSEENITQRDAVDKYILKSGARYSNEMSGIIGDKKDGARLAYLGTTHQPAENLAKEIDDTVTFELKDGVLTFNASEKNRTAGGSVGYAELLEPWSHNKYIKTVVIDENITDFHLLLGELPNLETVIIMDNATFMGSMDVIRFIDCPNLKNVIYGANLKDTTYEYDWGHVKMDYTEKMDKRLQTYFVSSSDVLGGKWLNNARILENTVALTSRFGDWDARVAKAKHIIADANLPESVLAKLPAELGGGAAAGNKPETPVEIPETKPNNINISAWATANVQTATDKGIVPAAALGNDYTKPITRSQFCAIANAVYETKTGTTVTYNGNPFKDVDDSNTAVLKMASKGVVSGYGGGMFGPNDRITREQAATMIARLSAAMGDNLPSKATSFTDKFNTWAIEPVSKVYGAGIMNGYSKTAFGAKDSYTIEQSIVSLLRTFEYGQVAETPDEPVEEENTTPPQPEVPDKPAEPDKPDDTVTEPPTEDTHIVELRSNLKMVKGTDKNGRTTITIKDKDDDMGMMPSDVYTLNKDGTVTRVEMRAFEQVGSAKTYGAVIIKDANGNVVFDSKNA